MLDVFPAFAAGVFVTALIQMSATVFALHLYDGRIFILARG
jgi:Na+/phosphate symporter